MTNIKSHEIQEAWRYAEIAYRTPKAIKSTLGGAVTIDPFVPNIGGKCVIVPEGERLVIAFAGSDDVVDWLANADWHAVAGEHHGIARMLEPMMPEIRACISIYAPEEILITGHSLGGGLADLLLEKMPTTSEITCITFAQPRVFVDSHRPDVKLRASTRYLRVATNRDPVPHLPPSAFGYSHFGDSLMIGKKMTWLDWWGRVLSRDTALPSLGDLIPHQCEYYASAVRALRYE